MLISRSNKLYDRFLKLPNAKKGKLNSLLLLTMRDQPVDRVLGYTFGVDSQYFSNLKKSPHDILITSKESVTTNTAGTTNLYNSKIPNRHKFNLKGTPPVVQTKGGTASFATSNNIEIVCGIACALKPNGIREPHWPQN